MVFHYLQILLNVHTFEKILFNQFYFLMEFLQFQNVHLS